ncbi:MAG: CotH kinase family protein [Saprospiraceae bacterium]|nr:CotH kinase family protein [Saprospiraceae bacterium]
MNRFVTLLILIFGTFSMGNSQVTINEYSASNLLGFLDSFNKGEDWVELYNDGDESVDLSGWHLSDKSSKPGKWTFPEGAVILPKGFLTVYCSGRDGVFPGGYHTNFKLQQTTGKDIILLSDKEEEIIDLQDLRITSIEHSNCRNFNGGSTWKVCIEPTFNSSNNGSIQYDRYTVAPSMDLAAGYYEGMQTVELTNNEENSILRYTLDGTNPTPSSQEYKGPISFSTTTVVKAQSFSNDPLILPGKMDFNTYFINEDFSVAVFSVAADDVIELANGEGQLIPIGSIEYFNLDKEREATSFGSLNRHGQDSWALDHRSLDWVSRDEMGYSKAVEAPLFSYSERDEYQKFMFRNSGDDNYPAINDFAHEGSTHIRDEYVQTLAMEGKMKLDTRAVERVVLFLNGEYWGLYGMRERPVDADYTDEYYDQDKYNIQYLSTWGGTEIEYGGQEALTDWLTVRDFVLKNDMSLEENYAAVEDQINLVSLIDYMIVNLNVVASDWLNYNTGWWRGLNPEGDHKKWGYILWDLDATFDYYINYSGVPNTQPDAEPCSIEDIATFMDGFFGNEYPGDTGLEIDPESCTTIMNGSSPYPATDTIFIQTIIQDEYCCDTDWDNICQDIYDSILEGTNNPTTNEFLAGDIGRHETILLKLLEENETFKQLYYSRYADIMNTVFTCENMNETLDRMLDVIRPEMPRQIERWGGSMMEWESNVQDLKDFINERCLLLDDGMINCYEELNGPHKLTLMAEPEGIGEIDLNTLDIEDFPWEGDYFGGMENKIKARVFGSNEAMYEFSHWESKKGSTILPDLTTRKATIVVEQADTLTAVFKEKTVSTEELQNDSEFRIYPNPAKDYLVVDFNLPSSTAVDISLYNVIGERLISFSKNNGMKSAGRHSEQLDLSTSVLKSGLYILVIDYGSQKKSFKVNVLR